MAKRGCQAATERALPWSEREGGEARITAFGLALSSHLKLQGTAEGGKGRVGFCGREEPPATPSSQRCHGPWPPAHRSWSRSCVSFRRAFRCRMHTSFCCRGVKYCSGVGGLMPWLSLHSVYFMERLPGGARQRGARKGPGDALGLQAQGSPVHPSWCPAHSPWSPAHPSWCPTPLWCPPSPPPAPCRPGLPLCPCVHENTRPFWKVGFIKVLLREEHSVEVGRSGLL